MTAATTIKAVDFLQDGQKFHALVSGDPANPVLLFLHGFPEYSGAWVEVISLLSDRWFCVAPDQRGYGQSWRPEGVENYATKHLVKDVAGFIDYFGQGCVAALIGHDWGASVAYATAMRWPQKIGKLVVANGVHPAPFQAALAAGGAQSAASQYITWMRNDGAEDILAADDFARMFSLFGAKMDWSWMTETRRAAYKQAWGDAAGLRAMINWYRATPLKVAAAGVPIPADDLPKWDVDALRISMPHLLIWGQADTALLAASRAGLENYCASLIIRETAEADHWILHQKPEFVANAISEFLAFDGDANG